MRKLKILKWYKYIYDILSILSTLTPLTNTDTFLLLTRDSNLQVSHIHNFRINECRLNFLFLYTDFYKNWII